jgi:cytochrome bd ubiquinol oxidase subunit I
VMVGLGFLLLLAGLWALYEWWRHRRLPSQRLFWLLGAVSGLAAIVAMECGWVVTEVGRQPWVVYRVMPTVDAVTGAGGIPVGYGTLVITYVAVACGVVWILRRLASMPIGSDGSDSPPPSPHGLPV